MHRSALSRLSLAMLAATAIAVAACSSDSTDTSPVLPTAAKVTVSPTGTDSNSTTNPTKPDTSDTPPVPTSNGPVASIKVEPANSTIQVGWYLPMIATPYDANGVRVVGKKATWTVLDANVLTMTDTGIVRGKAVGTTKVYGTIDGHIDSATVTVIPAVAVTPPPIDSTTIPPDSSQTAPTIASFNLTVHVTGALQGADTSKVENVAGVAVSVSLYGKGSASTPAGTATTDANGVATFTGLTGGIYTIQMSPAAGSVYDSLAGGFGPATTPDVALSFTLHRKS